jgi:hypothetical protein
VSGAPRRPFRSKPTPGIGRLSKALYRSRACIELCFGKLKRSKRIALRCEKTERSFATIVTLTLGLIIAKSVRASLVETAQTSHHSDTSNFQKTLSTEIPFSVCRRAKAKPVLRNRTNYFSQAFLFRKQHLITLHPRKMSHLQSLKINKPDIA